MYKVLLGGGLASGKSTVAKILEDLGAEVENLDRISVEVRNSPDVAGELADAFGPGILDADGEPIPSVLAERAFSSEDAVAKLDSICLPRISERARGYLLDMDATPSPMRVLEVPLLDRAPELHGLVDEIVVVVAPEELRLRRAIARGLSEQDARNRIGSQASQEELEGMADTIIRNDSTEEELARRVRAWWDSRIRS